jgi:hypothetical protein
MSRRWLLSLLCLSVSVLCLVPLTRAGGDVRVNEADTKFLLDKDPAEVVLAIENSTGKTMDARVVVELLDPNSKSKAKTTQHVKFDKTDGKINDEITCNVETERVGSRGWGMILAEIGVPPGADVDRSSLEMAVKNSGWTISQYDVLPDRVVVYLWPPSGGVKFNFKFRPRFGLNAKTAASVVYDYYNPEARAVVEPATFRIK